MYFYYIFLFTNCIYFATYNAMLPRLTLVRRWYKFKTITFNFYLLFVNAFFFNIVFSTIYLDVWYVLLSLAIFSGSRVELS